MPSGSRSPYLHQLPPSWCSPIVSLPSCLFPSYVPEKQLEQAFRECSKLTSTSAMERHRNEQCPIDRSESSRDNSPAVYSEGCQSPKDSRAPACHIPATQQLLEVFQILDPFGKRNIHASRRQFQAFKPYVPPRARTWHCVRSDTLIPSARAISGKPYDM